MRAGHIHPEIAAGSSMQTVGRLAEMSLCLAYHLPSELGDRQLSGTRRFVFYVLSVRRKAAQLLALTSRTAGLGLTP